MTRKKKLVEIKDVLMEQGRNKDTRSIKTEIATNRTKYILEFYTGGAVMLMVAWMLVLVMLEAQCQNQKGKMCIKEKRVNSKIFCSIKQTE